MRHRSHLLRLHVRPEGLRLNRPGGRHKPGIARRLESNPPRRDATEEPRPSIVFLNHKYRSAPAYSWPRMNNRPCQLTCCACRSFPTALRSAQISESKSDPSLDAATVTQFHGGSSVRGTSHFCCSYNAPRRVYPSGFVHS